MKQVPIFIPPIISSTASTVSVDALEQAEDLHEQGKYVESIHRFLDGLHPEVRKKYGDPKGRVFDIPHGSVMIHIELTDDTFSISTDYLRLPTDERRLPMMRQVLDLNTRRLMLTRFVCRDNMLRLEYHCPLTDTHPYKLYSLVGNICFVANRHDDEFIHKFGAERVTVPQVRPYSDESVGRLHSALQTTGRYALDTVKEFVNERNYNGAWAVISTCFLQFLYYASPKGMLYLDVDKALTDLDDDLPTSEQVIRAVGALEELMSRSPEELAKDMYYAETLSSDNNASTLPIIKDNFEKGYEDATAAIEHGNYERATVRLLHIIYRVYHHYDMQEDVNAVLVEALRTASDKPVEVGGKILYLTVKNIMENRLEVGTAEVSLVKRLAMWWQKLRK